MQLSINLVIIIITGVISVGAFNNQKTYDDLIFYPPAISRRNQWYRLFTHGLIHADVPHLLLNMFTLYMFGDFVERAFYGLFAEKGKFLYLGMYILALAVSILPTYIKHRDSYHYRSLGASGAVSAVLFAGLLLAPTAEVGLFLTPPFIPGFIFAPLYLVVSIWLERRGQDNINHAAHIWGAIFGLVFVIVAGKFLANVNIIQQCLQKIESYFS